MGIYEVPCQICGVSFSWFSGSTDQVCPMCKEVVASNKAGVEPTREVVSQTSLLHKVTQAGYVVTFNQDFEGMLRIEYTEEFADPVTRESLDAGAFYEHDHVGCPDGSMGVLEAGIIKSLGAFIERHGLK